MKKKKSDWVPGALDLTEQAVHLLRQKGVVALAEYYIGALPFVFGLLFFWSDMSRNANADWYCAPAAAAMAMLFIWMKLWQVRYCRRLWGALNDASAEPWPVKRAVAVAARQALLQATGIVVLPVAMVIMLPLGWTYAFYQNLSVLETPDTKHLKRVYKEAVAQAALWPAQNHMLILILSVFALFVIVNVVLGLMMMPYLLKWLLGIETTFTLSGVYALTNTTFLATVSALAYLCIDPIIKAVYTLRCFYGLSRHTGDDLRAALKPFLNVGMAMLVIFCMAGTVLPVRGDQGGTHVRPMAFTSEADSADTLDKAIEQTLQQRRFAWRLPREKSLEQEDEKPGWLRSVLLWMKEKVEAVFDAIDNWIDAFEQWLHELFPDEEGVEMERKDYRPMIKLALYILGAGLIVLLAIMTRRWLRTLRAREKAVTAPAPAPRVDINDERISADDLPRDRWLALARELMEKQDFRQAMRALYLALLAQLGDKGRVVIARHKSNREYLAELQRHAHVEPVLAELFSHCMSAYERAWYGLHPVAEEQLAGFVADQERISSLVQQAA